jgi:hypothetical protein
MRKRLGGGLDLLRKDDLLLKSQSRIEYGMDAEAIRE